MRIYLILFCVVILTACAFERTADQAYKEGKYLESISLIIAYVEEKGEQKLDADDLTHFRQLVSDVMGHYENRLLTADRNDHNSRIESLVALLNMKSQLANRFFSQQVSFFNNKYDFFSLRKAIAEEYYLWGNAVTCESSSCYSMRADLYKKGLEYYKYNDIENLYQKAIPNICRWLQMNFIMRVSIMHSLIHLNSLPKILLKQLKYINRLVNIKIVNNYS